MLAYVLIVLIPFLFTMVTMEKGRIYVCGDSEKRKRSMALPVFFFMLFAILAVRHETIGRDLPNYKYYFEMHSQSNLKQLQAHDMEPLFKLFNWIVGHLTHNFQWYLAIVALICIVPIAMVYLEDREHSYLKIVLFLNMSIFIMLFSGIRQSLAMAMGMIAYRFVRKKKLPAFIAVVLVAVGIHHSAIMLFFMYPAYYMALRKKHFYIIIPAILACYVFNQQIFALISTVLSSYADEYEVTAGSTGAFGMLFLFILFAVFSHVIPDEAKMDQEMLGLRNLLLVAVLIQCFAPLHNLAMRMNYYYILFIPVLIPKVIKAAKDDYVQVATTAKHVMCAFFTVYFLIGIYNSYVTGISALDTVPYIPFWRGY